MKRLLYLLSILSFTGCEDSSQATDFHQNIIPSNTINQDSALIKELDEDSIEYKIFPIDESESDASIVEFIDKLKQIVANKDTSELFKVLGTAVVVSHGGAIYGIKEFSQTWNLDRPHESKLWTILTGHLAMGGTWEHNGEGTYFCIPYALSNKVFSKYKYEFDWYYTAVCIHPLTKVYQEPDTTSQEAGTLSYDIVEIDPSYIQKDFTKIHTLNKKIKGYVLTKDLLCTAEPFLVIQKINDHWKITSFAPFD